MFGLMHVPLRRALRARDEGLGGYSLSSSRARGSHEGDILVNILAY